MAPPPATPAPSSRFLLSKRQPAQSQPHITPSQPASTARQFNATPRFSLSSTPRVASSQAAQFSTPAILPARVPSTRSKPTQDLIDVESSPESSDAGSPNGREKHDEQESDDVIASFHSESPSDEHRGGRSAKRRRISISPAIESSPPHAPHSDESTARFGMDVDPPSGASDAAEDDLSSSRNESESDEDDRHAWPHRPASPPRFLFQNEQQTQAQVRQAFNPPPQFRQPSAAASLEPQYPLPDAFSPQRRGAKYVNGGLAGELRDWLVDIKGTGNTLVTTTPGDVKASASEGATVEGRVAVEEVRLGTGFWLAHARNQRGESIDVVLAGEGRLTGLAERRNSVTSGCTVVISPLTWDVILDRQRWKVACDWYVVSPGV